MIIYIYIYVYILKVYSCMTELIFNIKCSCLDSQILREKVQFWGGHNFGSNNKGWATKIKPLFLGEGVKKMIYIDVEKLPAHPPPKASIQNYACTIEPSIDLAKDNFLSWL